MKATPEQIRQRFDSDVERFSNLETGQTATVDAPLVLDLIAQAAATVTPAARAVLDVGCGAGNYTLKLLQRMPNLDCTLLDLSQAMLDRARQRIEPINSGHITLIQSDVCHAPLGDGQFDIILASMVLHHLRDDRDWENVFAKFYRSLRPGGSIWISDLIEHTHPGVQQIMWKRYSDYLTNWKDAAYREKVFAFIDAEDTPRPLMYQIDLLRRVGFTTVEILHKNSCFAAFGAIKS